MGAERAELDRADADKIMRQAEAEGRRAMKAYQRQRQLAFAAPSKLDYVEHLLHEHRNDRVLLFTERNDSAHLMSRRFLVPVITHQTKVSERSTSASSSATRM